MSLLYIIKMNCKEATYLHEKKKEANLSLSEKVGLALHLLLCRVCALFFRQIDEIEKCVHHSAESENGTLSNDAKQKMQEVLNNEMN